MVVVCAAADVPGGVLKPRQEGETQFLDNLSNDKMHAHILCIYLFISNILKPELVFLMFWSICNVLTFV